MTKKEAIESLCIGIMLQESNNSFAEALEMGIAALNKAIEIVKRGGRDDAL